LHHQPENRNALKIRVVDQRLAKSAPLVIVETLLGINFGSVHNKGMTGIDKVAEQSLYQSFSASLNSL